MVRRDKTRGNLKEEHPWQREWQEPGGGKKRGMFISPKANLSGVEQMGGRVGLWSGVQQEPDCAGS